MPQLRYGSASCLQSAQDPGTVTCNPELEAALQQKVVKMAALPALVGSHCHTEPPPRFSHTVRCGQQLCSTSGLSNP